MSSPNPPLREMSKRSRQFWKGRDLPAKNQENANLHDQNGLLVPSKKDSIENLKKAERVTNVKSSTMFAASKELTPENIRSRSQSTTDRPMVAGSPLRPLTNSAAAAAAATAPSTAHDISERNAIDARLLLPSQQHSLNSRLSSSQQTTPSASPTKLTHQYHKSSISSRNTGAWSDSARDNSERLTKTVTFDDAPPQVNEYEMATPAPSSTTSSLHDGEYDSDEFEEESFERGSSVDIDDSFDASLEDTEKTPVVLPDDWRFMHDHHDEEEEEEEEEDEDDSTEMGDDSLTEHEDSQLMHSTASSHLDSMDASAERRPLPMPPSSSSSASPISRPLPSQVDGHAEQRASLTANDMQKVDARELSSLEERLELLRIRESAEAIKEAQRQRERRLRRGGFKQAETLDKENKRPSSSRSGQSVGSEKPSYTKVDPLVPPVQFHVSKDSALKEIRAPRPGEGDSAMEFASMNSESELIPDPDTPLPSVEHEGSGNIEIEHQYHIHDIEEEEEDQGVDEGEEDIHHLADQRAIRDVRGPSPDDHPHDQVQHAQEEESIAHDGLSTDAIPSPAHHAINEAPMRPHQQFSGDFTPGDSGLAIDSQYSESLVTDHIGDHYDDRANPVAKEAYDDYAIDGRHTPESQIDQEDADSEGTPESVIRHPIPESAYGDDTEDSFYYGDEYDEFSFEYSPEPEDVPEYIATVRAPDGHYKIRPSLTSADVQTMAAKRREISVSASFDGRQMQDAGHEYEYEEDPNDVTPTLEDDRTHDQLEVEAVKAIEEEEAHERDQQIQRDAEYLHEEQEEHEQQHIEQGDDQHHKDVEDREVIDEQYDQHLEDRHEDHQQHQRDLDQQDQERGQFEDNEEVDEHEEQEHPEFAEDEQDRGKDRSSRPSLVKLDVPVSTDNEDLSLGISEEFERLMKVRRKEEEAALEELRRSQQEQQDAQPKLSPIGTNGRPKYLMRQATKVVVASSRPSLDQNTRRKDNIAAKHRRSSQFTWTTEPWTSNKGRRQSLRNSGVGSKRRSLNAQTHQNPGQNGVDGSIEEEFADGEERGRLFVKVIGVKDLELPLPRGQRNQFSLTLDNGMHCVTTNWLDLARSAPIGQEFELVVLNDLEFQLTLQMKIDPPKPKPVERPPSPARTTFTRPKTSTFSRVFGSPKKRREMELRMQQEMEQQVERERQRHRALMAQSVDPWEKVRPLVANDGSFGRAYIALSEHEKAAFGRPYSTQVACFNEWATEATPSGTTVSRFSKKTTSTNSPMAQTPQPQRRPPYRIGTLEVQFLYVPKPKGAEDKDMPKSMNAAIREMTEAENTATKSWKGFLSQQGGDCPYWRRRFFKLQGSKLTAYHESTLQPRATINLAKAAKLVDDKSILTQKDTTTRGGARRRSAFAEDEEGYMFVEEGFRIRFGNGEVIDFYADSPAEKENWMEMLSQVVGKGSALGSGPAKAWTEIVLRRERTTGFKAGNLPSLPPANQNAAAGSSLTRPPAPGPSDRPMSRGGGLPPPSLAIQQPQPMSPSRIPRQAYPIPQANLPSPLPPSLTPHIPAGTSRSANTPAMRHSNYMAPSHVDSHMRAMQARQQKTKSMLF
ncbi:hypothetical protein KEM56_007752 [Ascosphaera pollenicola]|nr:hypothetical protein KEM56_007752 [Ascosphaera pollenicola]